MTHATIARSLQTLLVVCGAFLSLDDTASANASPPGAHTSDVSSTALVRDVDTRVLVLEGIVLNADGTGSAGAVVVSTAGGQAVTDAEGRYRLEVDVETGLPELRVTAIGSGARQQVASRPVRLSVAARAVQVGPMQLSLSTVCTPAWIPTFGGQPGTDDQVLTFAVFDDGSGPALYVGGAFRAVGTVLAEGVARWDGTQWSTVGSNLSGTARALVLFDDGSGSALYAGGTLGLTSGSTVGAGVARWDGTTWSPVGPPGTVNVNALAVYDDGGGEALYAGGTFTPASPIAAEKIAKWDGASWQPLGIGLSVASSVNALTVFDDGSGSALYAGGQFLRADGLNVNSIARWNGSTWSGLGAGMTTGGSPATVHALAGFDDGTGPALFAGGSFVSAGSTTANSIAKWDGSSWSALGTGTNGSVYSLTPYDDGGGTALFVGGSFNMVDGIAALGIARWNGSIWSPVGDGLGGVRALVAFDPGSGTRLMAGGGFRVLGGSGIAAQGIAAWDGALWSPLGDGIGGEGGFLPGSPAIKALTVFDTGCGPELFVGGDFTGAGGVRTDFVARWTGVDWVPLGEGMNDEVRCLVGFDDGSGPALYAGGTFTTAGGATARRIARWTGTSWEPVGAGLFGPSNASVECFEVFDDGSGPELYIGGRFTGTSGANFTDIAKWDGTNLQGIGLGAAGTVRAMALFDDGGGTGLYVAGDFSSIDAIPLSHVARWNGTSWSALGSGTNNTIRALEVFDDGSGPALFATGSFSSAGGNTANRIASWDGATWSAVGTGNGISGGWSLAAFDDGSGPALYVGGAFNTADAVPADNIARWDGVAWSAVGNGTSGLVHVLETFDDGSGLALFVGGEFDLCLDSGDSFLAKWGCPGSPVPHGFADLCNGDGGDQLGCTNCPCSNNAPQGSIGGCLNSTANPARLVASGDTSVTLPSGDTTDLRFAMTGAPPSAFCVLTSGGSLAPANAANPCYGLNSGVQFFQFDGLRCAVSGTRRHGGRPADANGEVGTTNAPWGGEGGPPAGIAVAGDGFIVGQSRFFQVTYRDDPLAQCMRGLNTSQAVCVLFKP